MQLDGSKFLEQSFHFFNCYFKQKIYIKGIFLPGVDLTKLFFLRFFFFRIKLGHSTINNFFSVCIENASLPAKNGKILH